MNAKLSPSRYIYGTRGPGKGGNGDRRLKVDDVISGRNLVDLRVKTREVFFTEEFLSTISASAFDGARVFRLISMAKKVECVRMHPRTDLKSS